jgi:hypothetical protein
MRRRLMLVVIVAALAVAIGVVVAGCTITAGGFIPSQAGDVPTKAHFALQAKGDLFDWTGTLEFQDIAVTYPDGNGHDVPVRLRGIVTGGVQIGNHQGLTGTYTVQPNKYDGGTFYLWVEDGGEPGTVDDEFYIKLQGGIFDHYQNSGNLAGGNIQIHEGD